MLWIRKQAGPRLPDGDAVPAAAGDPGRPKTAKTTMRRAAVLAGLPVLFVGLTAGTAAAASGGGQVSNYPCTGTGINEPYGITAGPNGAVWFTSQGGEPDSTGGSIGEIAAGVCSNYGSSLIDDPTGITAADGALWFTNFGYGTGDSIGDITTTGQFTFYTNSQYIDGPEAITVGPDGALWFTNAGNSTIGRFDPTTDALSSYSGAGIDDPTSITAGPDGQQALWFTNNQNDTIGEITTGGAVSNYALDGNGQNQLDGPFGITAGPDGALWFTVQGGGPYGDGSIGRITTSGALTDYTGSTSLIDVPAGITTGPDGALWYTNYGTGTGDSIGRISTSGTIYSYTGTGIDGPQWITPGPDGEQALWFTNSGNNSIGEITTAASQTISFTSTPPASPPLGSTYAVSATATSGLSVTFTISTTSVCSISGSTVTFNHAGSCVIDANQAGNAGYQAAPQAQQAITVPQETPALTWATPADIVSGTALSGIQLDAKASVAGTFAYSPPAGTALAVGTHTLTATFTPTDTTDYTSGGTVSTQITVLPKPCTLPAWKCPAP
jgi:virginiamycin B lyase